MKEALLHRLISNLCAQAKYYNGRKGAIRSSSIEGVHVVNQMKKLSNKLALELGLDNSKFEVLYSKGQSNIPRVMWIAIVPLGRTVSISSCVAICFGKRGEGIISGLMEPASAQITNLSTVKRSNINILIDVDGERQSSKYNDKFINPLEMTEELIDMEVLILHLQNSLRMLSRLLEENLDKYHTYKLI